MAIKVAMQNAQTKEIRLIKVGWSWTLFCFSSFFGIPLFRRKLKTWAYLFLGIDIAFLVLALFNSPAANFISFVILVGEWALLILLGIKGNEITAKTWLAQGWQFVDPDADPTKFAKMQWSIFDPPRSTPPTAAGQVVQT